MKINYQPSYSRIPVAIKYDYMSAPTYAEMMARRRIYEYKHKMGYIKQFVDKELKQVISDHRNMISVVSK
jgi:hypothetical protein